MSKSNRAKFNSHKSHVLFKTPRGNLYEISSQRNHRATARLSHLRHNNSLRDRRNFFRRLGRFDNIFFSPTSFLLSVYSYNTCDVLRNDRYCARNKRRNVDSKTCKTFPFYSSLSKEEFLLSSSPYRASLIFFRRQYLPLRSLINGAALLVDTVNKPTRYAINFAHSCTRLCVANILCLLYLRLRKKRRRVDPTVYARYQR